MRPSSAELRVRQKKIMAIQTFEYCSLHYLNQWLTYDRGFCESLSRGSKKEKLGALKSAGGFYRVARNLPSEFDEKIGYERYEPVLEILDSVSQKQFVKNPVSKIQEIEKEISKKYGGRGVLSLTTKFLWLKIKSPIKIYDSQAKIAVESKNGNLFGFYENWTKDFTKKKIQIEQACSKLPELHLYAVDQSIATKRYIQEVSSQTWFHERVFDIFLWNKGNKPNE
jgi:hypothetical protein